MGPWCSLYSNSSLSIVSGNFLISASAVEFSKKIINHLIWKFEVIENTDWVTIHTKIIKYLWSLIWFRQPWTVVDNRWYHWHKWLDLSLNSMRLELLNRRLQFWSKEKNGISSKLEKFFCNHWIYFAYVVYFLFFSV